MQQKLPFFLRRNTEIQVEELEADQRNSEEEKKTLNQLLRLAIQQKLTLTQVSSTNKDENEQNRSTKIEERKHMLKTRKCENSEARTLNKP